LMLWATCSSYSRIYLGVHFISDIIPGILAGLFFGWLVYKLFVLVHKKIFAQGLQIRASEINGVTLISLLLISTVVILIIISLLLQRHPAVANIVTTASCRCTLHNGRDAVVTFCIINIMLNRKCKK